MENIIGKRFNMLTVIKRIENQKGHIMYLCKCDCGNIKEVRKSHLIKNEVKSCGCLVKKIKETFGEKRKRKNKYSIYDSYAVGRDGKGNQFKISLCDLKRVSEYYWYCHDGYFKAERNGCSSSLHRFILNPSKNKFVDHIDGDRGNNTRENLREFTNYENSLNHKVAERNTSGYTGVYFHKRNNKWIAYINFNHKRYNLGSYSNKDDAVAARMKGEEKYFKDFKRKNKAKDDIEGGKYEKC